MPLLNKLILAGIVISSLLIFFQDLREKQISFWVLRVFSAFILLESFIQTSDKGEAILINLVFCLLQFSLVTIYFSIKKRRFVKIYQAALNWGDIWVILSLAFAFYWVNYVYFLAYSYLIIAVLFILARAFLKRTSKKIPVAGMLCFIYAVVKIIFFLRNVSTFNGEIFS